MEPLHAKVKELYATGASYRMIGLELHISKSRVTEICRLLGLPLRNIARNRRLSAKDEAEVVRLYTSSEATYSAISKRFNISYTTFLNILIRNGIPRVRGRGKPTPQEIKEQIVNLHLDHGVGVHEICRKVRRSYKTVVAILKAEDAFTPMRRTHLDQAQRDRLVKRYQTSTESAEEIARNFHVDPQVLYRELRLRGLPTRQPPVSEKQAQEMVRLYVEERKTCAEIGKATNRHPHTVYEHLKKRGVKILTRGEWHKIRPLSGWHFKKMSFASVKRRMVRADDGFYREVA